MTIEDPTGLPPRLGPISTRQKLVETERMTIRREINRVGSPFWTARNVADFFMVRPTTVKNWILKGWLRAYVFGEGRGRRYRIAPRALRDFFQEYVHHVRPDAEPDDHPGACAREGDSGLEQEPQ